MMAFVWTRKVSGERTNCGRGDCLGGGGVGGRSPRHLDGDAAPLGSGSVRHPAARERLGSRPAGDGANHRIVIDR